MHLNRLDLERLVVSEGTDPELSAIQGHLNQCQTCQLELAAKLDEENATANRAGRIKVLDPITSNGPARPAQIQNASAQSLHVRVPRPIVIGALVHVHSSSGTAFGKVRYCIPAGPKFQVGIKL